MSSEDQAGGEEPANTTWGPKLFFGTFLAVLVFFWWLLIYSHGVAPME